MLQHHTHLPEVHRGVQGRVPRHRYRLDERVLGRGGPRLAPGLQKYHTAAGTACPGGKAEAKWGRENS